VQATLLDEWRGYFPGPSQRFWYLSDGGHFDNTALYEMLRRRLPFVIAVDGGEDPDYVFGDLAILTRAARVDFGAELRWIDPGPAHAGWQAIEQAAGAAVPAFIKPHVDPDQLVSLEGLKRAAPVGAALARVTYAQARERKETWILLLKATVGGAPEVDVRNYAAQHPAFPNETTFNQFFSDSEWESYRMLGWWLARKVLR
jgi:hypothetical protein